MTLYKSKDDPTQSRRYKITRYNKLPIYAVRKDKREDIFESSVHVKALLGPNIVTR